MRSNTLVLAVFVLTSSVIAAPVTNRPVSRRSVVRRSEQAILSKSTAADCTSESANGSSWSEELCAQMPHVTGFLDAETGACRMPKKEGAGNGTCHIKSDRPISRVYRRMMPVSEDLPKGNVPSQVVPVESSQPPQPSSSDLPSSSPSVLPAVPPPAEAEKADASSTSTETPAATPLAGSSHGQKSQTATPTTDATAPASESADAVLTPPDAQAPFSAPKKSPLAKGAVPSSTSETAAPTTTSTSEQEPAGLTPPVQAPFAAPKHQTSATSATNSTAAVPSSTSTSTSSHSTSTSTPIPLKDVPIAHGTEGTWGGTLINGLNSKASAARTGGPQRPVKLGRVVGNLFFDLVYGRFLF